MDLGKIQKNVKNMVHITSAFQQMIHTNNSPEDRETLCPDVLAAMLDTGYQVWYKLVDGPLVLDRA